MRVVNFLLQDDEVLVAKSTVKINHADAVKFNSTSVHEKSQALAKDIAGDIQGFLENAGVNESMSFTLTSGDGARISINISCDRVDCQTL